MPAERDLVRAGVVADVGRLAHAVGEVGEPGVPGAEHVRDPGPRRAGDHVAGPRPGSPRRRARPRRRRRGSRRSPPRASGSAAARTPCRDDLHVLDPGRDRAGGAAQVAPGAGDARALDGDRLDVLYVDDRGWPWRPAPPVGSGGGPSSDSRTNWVGHAVDRARERLDHPGCRRTTCPGAGSRRSRPRGARRRRARRAARARAACGRRRRPGRRCSRRPGSRTPRPSCQDSPRPPST